VKQVWYRGLLIGTRCDSYVSILKTKIFVHRIRCAWVCVGVILQTDLSRFYTIFVSVKTKPTWLRLMYIYIRSIYSNITSNTIRGKSNFCACRTPPLVASEEKKCYMFFSGQFRYLCMILSVCIVCLYIVPGCHFKYRTIYSCVNIKKNKNIIKRTS